VNDQQIFSTLVRLGKLSELDIREIFGLTDELKKFIDLFQLLVGQEDGEEYLKEQTFAACWSSPVHLKWIGIAEKALKVLELSAVDALDSLTTAYNLIGQNRDETVLFIALSVYQDQLSELISDEVLLLPAYEPSTDPETEQPQASVADDQLSFLSTLDEQSSSPATL